MPPSASLPILHRRGVLLGGLAALMACAPAWARTTGSGREASETRSVADFEAIAVADSIDLVVRQGEREALVLSGDDNLLPLVETVVENGSRGRTLVIRLRRGESVSSRRPIKATVDVVRLQALALAGSGRAAVGTLKTPALRLSLAGSGDARLEALTTDALEVRVSGSGNVQGAGTAGQVKLTIAGSGDAKVTANKSLGVTIAGSGDVVYGGAVTAVRSSVAGSGSVTRR